MRCDVVWRVATIGWDVPPLGLCGAVAAEGVRGTGCRALPSVVVEAGRVLARVVASVVFSMEGCRVGPFPYLWPFGGGSVGRHVDVAVARATVMWWGRSGMGGHVEVP